MGSLEESGKPPSILTGIRPTGPDVTFLVCFPDGWGEIRKGLERARLALARLPDRLHDPGPASHPPASDIPLPAGPRHTQHAGRAGERKRHPLPLVGPYLPAP